MDIRPELGRNSDGLRILTPLVFYKRSLSAVKRQEGLIHGHFKNGGVCALGALADAITARKGKDVCLSEWMALSLQQVNDSVPDATPKQRRAVVIRWLERKIKDEERKRAAA